jgi:threonine dehydratase
LEIGEEISPDVVLVPSSGGGLTSGVALALPNARIVGCEPEGHDDIARSLVSGKRERNAPGIRSICDGLLSEEMGDITYEIVKQRVERVAVMSDDAVRRAMKFAFQRLKIVLEPSGAISLAAALEGGIDLKGKTVAVVASGGNVDVETFEKALAS